MPTAKQKHIRKKRVKRPAGVTRILLVDAHPVIRKGLAHLIRGTPDLAVCGEAGNSGQALQMAKATRPDLAIIGLLPQELPGLELVKALRATCPKVKILVLSMQGESANAERAIRAGAAGYVSKAESMPKILEAARRVMRGEIYFSRKIATQMVATLAGRPLVLAGSVLDDLSAREMEILELLGDGLGRQQIAQKLHLDVSTVETHRTRLREKLRIKDAADLRQYAVKLKRARLSDNPVATEPPGRYRPPVSYSGGTAPRLVSAGV